MNQPYLIFICAALGVMAFLALRYFQSRLRTFAMSNAALEQEVEDLQEQLDRYIRKEQRSSREAAEYKQVREGLLTALSHEIRTPLNGIMGMASLLTGTSLTPEQLEFTRTIHDSGEHLLATVNRLLAGSILNLSKSGSLEDSPPESKDFSLRDCIEETLQLFAGTAAKKGVDLIYIIDAEVPEIITGDRKRLSQVLVNLVENAVRHTHTGEITISAGLLRAAEKNALDLCFEVKDTGSGIPAEKLEQLFKGIGEPEPATQHASDKAAGENQPAGFGLVICKRLVETMSGFIEAASEPGRGSHFTFSIRTAKSRQEARRSAARQHHVFEGRQVLVVDTHEARRNSLVKRLERMQMLPVAADSVRQALGILSRHPAIDLLIADNGLPPTELVELIKTAKSRKPVVSTVGCRNPGDNTAAPFDTVLSLPIRQHELNDHLLELLTTPAGESVRPESGPLLPSNLAQEYPLHILVAEDHPVNQNLALTVLDKLGYKPDMAANGKEVLERVSHQNYDIILMDVQMPEMDGLEATRMIRRCIQNQPIILAMTANAMQGDRDNCLQAGMDDYISKPLELDELIAQLKKWSAVVREKINNN
ncbi:MAG TPA: response regulator [Puia sp.]|uniref:response regulator n=1 Tax=Puia sp. TaxID=2045100 RepID=UPI002BC9B7D4|nr:response regulator [Puia sp.]HVU94222.1 response regulator [Puia sp.]